VIGAKTSNREGSTAFVHKCPPDCPLVLRGIPINRELLSPAVYVGLFFEIERSLVWLGFLRGKGLQSFARISIVRLNP